MKKYIGILFLFLAISIHLKSQIPVGCDVAEYGSVLGDNALEIKLVSSLLNEGDKTYYVCEFHVKRLGDWYNGTTKPSKPKDITKYLADLTVSSDLTFDKFVLTANVNSSVPVSLPVTWEEGDYEGVMYPMDEIETTSCNYINGATSTTVDRWFELSLSMGESYSFFPDVDTYWHMCTLKLEVLSGISGNVGLMPRDTKVKLHPSAASNKKLGVMGICFSGNGIQTLGGGEKPVLAAISGDTKICQGVGGTYTTSFTAGADGASVKWAVKKEGADVTADVVQGGAITSTTTSATFTWADDVPAGNYTISAIPTNAAGDGNEELLAVEVFVPTVTIAGNTSGCAGTALALTANPTTMQNYQWYIKNGVNYTLINGETQAVYTPTLPANGSAITYKVEVVATAAQGGCTASDEKTITINSLPPLAVETEIAGGKRPINSTKYALGDKIVVSVLEADATKYTYSWLEGSNVKTDVEYIIPYATAETYTIQLTVSPKSGGSCGKDTTIYLTKDGSLCAPTLALSGTGGNKICNGGVCRLTAEATNLCTDNSVLKYEWYKGATKLAEQNADGDTKAYYTATSAGTYTVRLYTSYGMVSKDVTITNNATLAETLTIPATTTIGAGETTILSAQCNNVKIWTWTPKELISGSNETQYVKTEQLTEETDFTVYAEQQNGCMSSGNTKVKIGNNGLQIVLEPSMLALCKGGSGTLKAKVKGGTAPYQFTWPLTNLVSSADSIAKYKHDGLTSDYTEYLTVTDAAGNSRNVEVKVTVATAEEPKLTLSGGDVCQGEQLTVGGTNVSNYTWYIKDNATGAIITKSNQGATLKMDNRGDYTVWVAGNTAVCSSDTAKTKANVTVNGFDLAWDPQPADYKLGGDINAGVRIDNATGTPYTFNWDALKNGQQTTAAGVNPSKYQVIAASENNYHFKVEASVQISDSKSCSKVLEADVSTKSGGLILSVTDKTVTQCTNGAVQISASAQGGTGAYTFIWYKAGDAATELRKQVYPVGGAATDVFVHGGFSNGDQVVVQVTDASSPVLTRRDTIVVNTSSANAPLADAGSDMTIKSGSTTVLFGSVTSGTAKSWHWSPDNWLATGESTKQYPTTKTLTGQQDYTLYVIGDNNCVSLPDKVTVNVTTIDGFTVNIDEPGLLCAGNTTQLSATTTPAKAGILWEWYETTGQLTNLNADKPDFAASETTTVFVKATVGGITATNSKLITVKESFAPKLEIQGFFSDKTAVCEGSELKVVATNTPTVALGSAIWYVDGGEVQSGNQLTFKAQLEDGVTSAIRQIKVEAQSTAGCPAIAAAEETVTIYAQPELEWDASSTLVVAQGDAVEMTAKLKVATKANYSYTWSHPDKVGTFGFNDAGNTPAYSLSATSSVTGLSGGAQVGDIYCFQVYVTDGNTCRSTSLHQDVIVDGDALIVELKPKYADGYCEGGMAILQATVKAATQPTGLTYEWSKNGTPISTNNAGYILDGNELVVKAPNETDTYQVKVTADGGKTGQSAAITLTKNTAHQAIALIGVDLLIPSGTRTALMATSSGTIKHWQWSPKEMLANEEDTLQNPYTVNLTNEQIYTVYGEDENSCVTQPANVTVSTTSVTPPEDGNKELFAVIEPDKRTICVNNKLQLNTKVWGNPGGPTSFNWNSSDHLDMTPGAEKPIFSTNQIGNYSYAVTVSRNPLKAIARTDIEVVSGTSPELAIDLSKTGLACAGSEIFVKVQNGVSVAKYTWIIDGVIDPAVTGNTYTWPSVENPTTVNVQVIAETSGSCMSNVIAMDSLVKPALKLDDLQVVDSCGQVILFSNAGKDQQYTWSLTTGDAQLQKAEGASADTLYLNQKTNFTAASVPYVVEVKVKPKNGGCESTGNKTGKIYFQPKVVLDKWTYEGEALSYTVREKGENVPVSIDNDHSNFGVGNSTLNWMSYAGVALTTSAEQAIVNNVQKEDTIVAIVTNKEAPGCVSRDSIPVYLYPDAPEVDIDTNTNRNNIKLTWKSIPADSVRVWGILDDAYNVVGNDYKRLASVKAINKQWIEPSMGDRLKFYYLQSVRKIGNKSFASQTVSDTVGWLRQTLYGENQIASGTENVFTYPFDMTAKGIVTDRDLFTKLIDCDLTVGGGMLGYWDFNGQVWNNETFMNFGSGPEGLDTPFNLTAGSAYNVTFDGALTVSGNLLLYGKLKPLVYDFKLNTGTLGNATFVLYPLSLCNRHSLQPLGDLLKCDLLGGYVFSTQLYDNITGVDVGDGMIWMPGEGESDSPFVKPWTPVCFTVSQEMLNWSK